MLGNFCEFLLKKRSFCGATKNFAANHRIGAKLNTN